MNLISSRLNINKLWRTIFVKEVKVLVLHSLMLTVKIKIIMELKIILLDLP